ncbi:MAG: Fe-S cluster assembly protein SufD, partial [Bacteroidales bacterium]
AEIFVGEGAYFDYYELEENTIQTKRVASTFVHQDANSNVLTNSITLTNGVTRNNFYVTFAGEGAESHLSGMAIADGEQHVDNFTFIDHAVPHCHSNELFKYVLNDEAQGSFAGRILVREGADKTEAYQSNKNLCATDKARMFTRPELEIYADDVKCSHGATVGQLDNQALFYLRSRGISEPEARMLLMYAFSSDVLDQIRLEPLKERLRMLVEKRFRGELAKCRTCAQDCH